MNLYPIKIYNSTTTYKSVINSTLVIRNLIADLQFINLCEKINIISYKPWIGIINSLNCNKTYLEYYVSRNMNLLITPINIKISNLPICMIKSDLDLQPNTIYTAKINVNISFLQNIRIYVIYLFLIVLLLKIFHSLYKKITIIVYKYVKKIYIKKIKFSEDNNYNNCTICLEEFILNTKVSILECDHIFHEKCIDNWIVSKKYINVKCPNCNTLILTIKNNDEVSEPLI